MGIKKVSITERLFDDSPSCTEAYSEPRQTFKMKRFAKRVNG